MGTTVHARLIQALAAMGALAATVLFWCGFTVMAVWSMSRFNV